MIRLGAQSPFVRANRDSGTSMTSQCSLQRDNDNSNGRKSRSVSTENLNSNKLENLLDKLINNEDPEIVRLKHKYGVRTNQRPKLRRFENGPKFYDPRYRDLGLLDDSVSRTFCNERFYEHHSNYHKALANIKEIENSYLAEIRNLKSELRKYQELYYELRYNNQHK